VTDYSDVQTLSQPSVRLLDVARALECIALLVGAAVVVGAMPMPGASLAAVLVGMAVVLRPRERVQANARAETRREAVGRLTAEGLVLRWRYVDAHKLPVGQARADALWSVRRDVTIWLENSARRLERYPEVAGILRAHRATGDRRAGQRAEAAGRDTPAMQYEREAADAVLGRVTGNR
jgi:hypothetical protein